MKTEWIDFATNPPKQEQFEVLAFHPDWIDEDFNPSGTRVGFMGGDSFISAKWINEQDFYRNDYQTPLKWKPIVSDTTVAKKSLEDFKDWYDGLSPAEKCTVWPPAGSGSGRGLYNMETSDIVEKFLERKI